MMFSWSGIYVEFRIYKCIFCSSLICFIWAESICAEGLPVIIVATKPSIIFSYNYCDSAETKINFVYQQKYNIKHCASYPICWAIPLHLKTDQKKNLLVTALFLLLGSKWKIVFITMLVIVNENTDIHVQPN